MTNTKQSNPITTKNIKTQYPIQQLQKKQEKDNYFGNKIALGSQELCGQLNKINNKRVLAHSLLSPSSTNIRRAIVQDQVKSDMTMIIKDLLNI
jgi:hypothetical protein